MYSIHFAPGSPRSPGKQKPKLHSVTCFEPSGPDASLAASFLNLQFLCQAVEVYRLILKISKGDLHG